MATKWYLLNGAAPYTPSTVRGAWDQTAQAVVRGLSAETSWVNELVAAAEVNANNEWDVLLGRFVSGRLAAQTITGTLQLLLPVRTNSAAADFYFHVHAFVTVGDSDTVRGTLLSDYRESAAASEWSGVTYYGRGFDAAQTLTDVACEDGDRIVLEIGYVARNSVTTSYTGTLQIGSDPNLTDLTGTTDYIGNGFITFSMDVALDDDSTVVPVRVTQEVIEVTSTGSPADVRVTQGVIEVFTHVEPPTDVRVTQEVIEVFYSIPPAPPPTEQEFDPDADVSGETIGLTWVELIDRAGDHHVSSKVDLPDPANYYYGYKEGEILTWGKVRRALSDSRGQYEATSFTWKVSDTARKWRGLLAAAATRIFLNRPVVIRMISDASRREP